MNTIGSIYVRSNKPSYNRSKMLQVHAEPRADSVGEHNASVQDTVTSHVAPSKNPHLRQKHLSLQLMGKGIHVASADYSSLFKSRN